EVSVPLPETCTEYVIEAVAIDGTEWRGASTRVRAELEHFATLELPAFVHAADTAIGRLVAGGGAKGITITVTRDGQPIPLMQAGKELAAGVALPGPRAEITFHVGPGDYVATVTDVASGAAIASKKRVDPPGKLRRIARSIR